MAWPSTGDVRPMEACVGRSDSNCLDALAQCCVLA